jgi:hypothetical protein
MNFSPSCFDIIESIISSLPSQKKFNLQGVLALDMEMHTAVRKSRRYFFENVLETACSFSTSIKAL